ncbi:DUF885 domain-containing protein [Kordiimonas aquimaris]|uniref:DUF885 domain-containing protein n=1 Tax=Kordiimonas aquimaris TaxID=707591 RepID=UPI0021D0C722|nr:DUF885 domain-containing protein [Kordiimonas aquimaris]
MHRIVLGLVIWFAASFINVSVADEAEKLHALFDAEWSSRLERNPLNATAIGAKGYDHRLPDVSPAAYAQFLAEDRAFLASLRAIDRSALGGDEQVNYDIFAYLLDARIAGAAYKPWRIPFLSDSGFHLALASSVETVPTSSVANYEAYIERLQKVGNYFDQQIANMQQGLDDGFSMPRDILPKIAPSFAAHADVKNAKDSAFYKPVAQMPDSIAPADKEQLRMKALKVVGEIVLPAYRRLNKFFKQAYMTTARSTLGAIKMPNGEAYYADRVKFYTTIDITPEQVHALGKAEVKRILDEMNAIIKEVGFKGDFSAFLEFLRTDPQFYADTPKDLLKEAAWISKRIDEKLPALFNKLPRTPYGVRAVPDEIAPNYTTGRYWRAIPGKRGGLFMVNTYALDKRPLYSLAALALHEGVPGHHLQNALAKEIQNVPDFRRNLYVNAFGEGWGLYSEKLGIEMGIYETPYEHFGRLSYEMWRAGRLVVDTGIHAMGWSRDEAVAFFMKNSALSVHNINTEVDRYISWPGQALAYKMGELKILELRARAEEALGQAFDVRMFHDAVLENGTLPLSLLEDKIDAYIEKTVSN